MDGGRILKRKKVNVIVLLTRNILLDISFLEWRGKSQGNTEENKTIEDWKQVFLITGVEEGSLETKDETVNVSLVAEKITGKTTVSLKKATNVYFVCIFF